MCKKKLSAWIRELSRLSVYPDWESFTFRVYFFPRLIPEPLPENKNLSFAIFNTCCHRRQCIRKVKTIPEILSFELRISASYRSAFSTLPVSKFPLS